LFSKFPPSFDEALDDESATTSCDGSYSSGARRIAFAIAFAIARSPFRIDVVPPTTTAPFDDDEIGRCRARAVRE